MSAPDLDVIKDIPGYKVILKAVLKSQIQQLVEQLAVNTDEESVILTASVADGTLSHLGSESGKGFLENHEDIKSQFLGFCLKNHHRKKQAEKERLEAEALQQSLQQTSPAHYSSHFAGRSPRFSPRGPGPIHPVALTRASPGASARPPGARHEPYPMIRPKRTNLNFDPGRTSVPQSSPSAKKGNGQVIKIEPDDGETSNQSESGSVGQDNASSQSPSHPSNSAAKTESGEKDDDAKSESSTSTIPNEPPAEGLSLDSDLNSEQMHQRRKGESESGDMDPNVSVKLEALTESEMDLEITGVEPGRPAMSQDNWDPNVSMGMNFDPTGATGNAGDLSAQGYNQFNIGRPVQSPGTARTTWQQQSSILSSNASEWHSLYRNPPQYQQDFHEYKSPKNSETDHLSIPVVQESTPSTAKQKYMVVFRDGLKAYQCQYEFCKKVFPTRYKMERHMNIHSTEKPVACMYCDFRTGRDDLLRSHLANRHLIIRDHMENPVIVKELV